MSLVEEELSAFLLGTSGCTPFLFEEGKSLLRELEWKITSESRSQITIEGPGPRGQVSESKWQGAHLTLEAMAGFRDIQGEKFQASVSLQETHDKILWPLSGYLTVSMPRSPNYLTGASIKLPSYFLYHWSSWASFILIARLTSQQGFWCSLFWSQKYIHSGSSWARDLSSTLEKREGKSEWPFVLPTSRGQVSHQCNRNWEASPAQRTSGLCQRPAY